MTTRQGLVSIEFIDAYGIAATTDFFVTIDGSQTVDLLVNDVNTLLADVEPLSQGHATRAYVRVLTLEDSTGTLGTGDIEKGGLFNFNNATDPYVQGYWIPDVNPLVLNANGLIDLTNVSVTSFITFMTTAHTVITVVTKGVRALSSLRDALISFRKKRKPLTRKTKEL